MSMRPIIHEGAEVSVSHLAPSTFGCPCDQINREIAIAVGYSNHCYTESYDASRHSREAIVTYEGSRDDSRGRVFCPVRYKLSHLLPGIVRSLPDKKVHQTYEQRNYVYSVKIESDGGIYQLFFRLRRAGGTVDLRLFVESAYPIEGGLALPRRPNAIRFSVLAYKVLRNQPVKFAPR